MELFNGLPAHPLFIHAPVVLVPMTTLLALVLAVRPTWRRRAWFVLPAAGAICLAVTQLAIMSGTAFDELAGGAVDISTHESLALWTRAFIILFLVASIVLAFLDRRIEKGEPPPWVGSSLLVTVAVTALSSVLASFWMYRTGHEGARLVWETVVTTAANG